VQAAGARTPGMPGVRARLSWLRGVWARMSGRVPDVRAPAGIPARGLGAGRQVRARQLPAARARAARQARTRPGSGLAQLGAGRIRDRSVPAHRRRSSRRRRGRPQPRGLAAGVGLTGGPVVSRAGSRDSTA